MLAWHPTVAAVSVPPGGRILSRREGVAATVTVIEDARGTATLHINNRQQEGSSDTLYADARQGLLPMLLHPAPRNVLFLGLGTGATARAAATAPSVRVDAVELLPDVITAAELFANRQGMPVSPGLRILAADARRFVRSAPRTYDVIVADNFHPARSGSGALYTVEHFTAVHERLSADGLFCQWLPLHQLDLLTMRSIVRSHARVFPHGWAMLATNSLDTPVVGLVARRDGRRFSHRQIRARLAAPRGTLSREVVDGELTLLGGFFAGPESLAEFAAGAPLNTDDHPVVIWMAPRMTYVPDTSPRERLLRLLARSRIAPGELLDMSENDASRLAGYWTARDLYLSIGTTVHPTRDARDMLAQVRRPLLSVLSLSPEFRPAYDPLVNMGRALARTNIHEARLHLTELAAVNPAWPEARAALADLGSGQP
jgi:spermidine synthase